MLEQGATQIVDDTFTYLRAEVALEHAQQTRNERQRYYSQSKPRQQAQVSLGDSGVNQTAYKKRRKDRKERYANNREQHHGNTPPVRPGVCGHTPEKGAANFR